MNLQRLLILGVAAIAAGGAALLVRGLLGGGTPKVAAAPAPVATVEVLVAASDLQAGQHLNGTGVKWQSWPAKSIDPSFITSANGASTDAIVAGTVVRAPIVTGEPITNTKIVHTDAAGMMAASLTPGSRAISIGVSTDTGAGGFILPNDRVDILATFQTSEQPKRYRSTTIIQNLRVLAMDQIYKEDKDQKVVIAKTATIEVTPAQAELVALATTAGTLSLALRGLSDSSASALASSAVGSSAGQAAPVGILRYGLPRAGGEARGE